MACEALAHLTLVLSLTHLSILVYIKGAAANSVSFFLFPLFQDRNSEDNISIVIADLGYSPNLSILSSERILSVN